MKICSLVWDQSLKMTQSKIETQLPRGWHTEEQYREAQATNFDKKVTSILNKADRARFSKLIEEIDKDF